MVKTKTNALKQKWREDMMRERLNNAIASSRIEGIEITAQETQELEEVITGKITAAEYKRRILAEFKEPEKSPTPRRRK